MAMPFDKHDVRPALMVAFKRDFSPMAKFGVFLLILEFMRWTVSVTFRPLFHRHAVRASGCNGLVVPVGGAAVAVPSVRSL